MWVKWHCLILQHFDDLAIELGCGCLVKPDVLFEPTGADSVKEMEGPEAINITGVFCHPEGDLDMGLGTEVVDFRGLDLGDDVDEVSAVD